MAVLRHYALHLGVLDRDAEVLHLGEAGLQKLRARDKRNAEIVFEMLGVASSAALDVEQQDAEVIAAKMDAGLQAAGSRTDDNAVIHRITVRTGRLLHCPLPYDPDRCCAVMLDFRIWQRQIRCQQERPDLHGKQDRRIRTAISVKKYDRGLFLRRLSE